MVVEKVIDEVKVEDKLKFMLLLLCYIVLKDVSVTESVVKETLVKDEFV